jgi:hypothetical protein
VLDDREQYLLTKVRETEQDKLATIERQREQYVPPAPKLTLPELALPKLALPKLTLPKFALPTLALPST